MSSAGDSLGSSSPALAPSAADDSLAVSEAALRSFSRSKPWLRFLGVVGFLLSLLMIVVGLVVVWRWIAQPALVVIAVAACYGLNAFLCFAGAMGAMRYANRIAELVVMQRTAELEAALEAQRRMWRLIGSAMVLLLAGFAVMALLTVAGFSPQAALRIEPNSAQPPAGG